MIITIIVLVVFSSNVIATLYNTKVNNHQKIETEMVNSKDNGAEVIVWKVHGFSAEKEVIKLSSEKMSLLKNDLAASESLTERRELYKSYGILNTENYNNNYLKKFSLFTNIFKFLQGSKSNSNFMKCECENKNTLSSTGYFFCRIVCYFSGFTVNLPVGVPPIYPFLEVGSEKITIDATCLTGTYQQTVNDEYLMFFMFFGVVVMIPIIDIDGGYCDGFSFLTFLPD